MGTPVSTLSAGGDAPSVVSLLFSFAPFPLSSDMALSKSRAQHMAHKKQHTMIPAMRKMGNKIQNALYELPPSTTISSSFAYD
eukprot:scaffold22356_cov66-Skeletonema_marinoi.AAC.1